MLRKLSMLVSLFALGAVGGSVYLFCFAPPEPTTSSPVHATIPVVDESISPLSESIADVSSDIEKSHDYVDYLKQGDRSLLTGNVHAANIRYQRAVQLKPEMSESLQMRLAICAELNHKYLLSERLYAGVETASGDNRYRLMARIGLCRVWRKLDRSEEALRAMCDLMLESNSLASEPVELQAEAMFELAELVEARALADYHFDPFQKDGLLFHQHRLDTTMQLELLDRPEERVGEDQQPIPLNSIQMVQRPTPDANNIRFTARTGYTPVRELVSQLAAPAGLKVTFSPQATNLMAARSRRLHLRSKALSLILDGLLTPLELTWIQEDEELRVIAVSELAEATDRRAALMKVAQRSYRQFSLSYPGDHRSIAAQLANGNLALLGGAVDQAGNLYQAVDSLKPGGELYATLAFNQGKLDILLGRTTTAIEKLYLAVDQTYDNAIKSCGYWWIGELYLHEAELEQAVYAAGRALSTARESKQKQLATVTLARIYLLKNDPASANKVLFDQRREFTGSPLKPLVNIVSNYAQFIGVDDDYGRRVAEERLVYSLTAIEEGQFPSYLDQYLAGRAYQELGMTHKALEKLLAASQLAGDSVWKNQIDFSLAVQEAKDGLYRSSAEILQQIIDSADSHWSRLARLELAKIYLENKMPEKCLEQCRQLRTIELQPAEKRHVLSMMGFAFRQLDQHHSSALCFAGIFPAGEPQ